MTEPSLFHDRRARGDCSHHISSYTLWYTQQDENNLKWVHVCGSFSNKVPWQFFFNSLILLERSFILKFTMAYLALLYFFDLALVLRARAFTNPFPDLPNFHFDSEDVVSILFRLSNFSEIFKVTHLSLPLISLGFLTFWQPQSFMFTNWNKSCLPVNFSSQNVFRVEKPW